MNQKQRKVQMEDLSDGSFGSEDADLAIYQMIKRCSDEN